MLEKRQHQRRTWLIILVLLWPAAASLPATADINERFVGKVLFMRHALAPGFGDPDYFSIEDCHTQRNLDETGRAQAREIEETSSRGYQIFCNLFAGVVASKPHSS